MLIRHKISTAVLCAATIASLAACSNTPEAAPPASPVVAPVVDTGKIADAVKADVSVLVAELNAHDIDKAVSHDAADMVGMFHGMPNVVGPAADKAMTAQLLTDPAFHLAVSNETVDIASAGDMAVYRATYAVTATDPKSKKTVVENGNWLVGYKHDQAGKWMIAWNVVSDTAPLPAATK